MDPGQPEQSTAAGAHTEEEAFERDGFLVVRRLADAATIDRMAALALGYATARMEPIEYEADLGYAGAPQSRVAPGGDTIRRLLAVYNRHPVFRDWARSPQLLRRLRALLGGNIVLSRAHHNCIMIKDTRHSSATPWHQDVRYWRFARPELLSVLLALGPADESNGCMRFVPGSHRLDLSARRFNDDLSLREELSENQELVARQQAIAMQPGDAVLFHCRTLHAADANRSLRPRVSLLFTYRRSDNPPVAGTRSDSEPEVPL